MFKFGDFLDKRKHKYTFTTIVPGVTFLQVYEPESMSVQSFLGLHYMETIFLQYIDDDVD